MFCEKCGQKLETDSIFCDNCGQKISVSEKSAEVVLSAGNTSAEKHNRKVIFIVLGVFALLIIIGIFSDSSSNNSSSQTSSSQAVTQSSSTQNLQQNNGNSDASKTYDQSKIVSSVVNILCDDGNGGSGGSGTIISSNGVILTNNHIIPQDKDGNPTVQDCMVTLPDSQGKVKEIYYGEPIIITGLSQDYDLAFIRITGAYTDDKGVTYGKYPNKFPSFFTDGCENDDVKLGEKVRVFGYPAISGGGYYLTITDGIVSSLPNDGTIVTSAKVDHGDSGGLAVDENGCMMGIPAMISSDKSESLGVIISNNVISEFANKLQTLIDQNK